MGKGASTQQKDIANSQQTFMTTLQSDFGTAFQGQQNILNGLNSSLTTTMSGGPSQFGFSSPEVTALNTTATSGASQALRNAQAAVGEAGAAGVGGANLPTGSQGETQAALEANAAQAKSNALLGIQQAGYVQGNKNYNTAVAGLTNIGSLENPASLGGLANNASQTAMNESNTVQQENQSASAWSQIGGLIGSLSPSAIMQSMTGGSSSPMLNPGSTPQIYQSGNVPSDISAPIDTSGMEGATQTFSSGIGDAADF